MFEYLKTKQTDSFKQGMDHSVVQQRTIPYRDSCVDRFTKPAYYPLRKMESVVQMCGDHQYGNYEEEESEEPDDPWDDDYNEPTSTKRQYLNPTTLRRNLGAKGLGGEAHHLIPGVIVKNKNLDNNGKNKNEFNKEWNGIMLNGSINKNFNVVNEFKGKGAPEILHRVNNERNHDYYNNEVLRLIAERKIQDLDDCKNLAEDIRKQIMESDEYALDYITFK